MKSFKRNCLLSILLVMALSFSGCSLLQIPGALIGGLSKVVGGVFNLAQKVPWWMWL